MRTKASLLAVLFLSALAACNGQTNPATSVTSSSATLNGSIHCDAGDGPGYARYRYRPAGTSTWAYTAQDGYAANACPNTSAYPKNIASLAAATTYEFELCGTGHQANPAVEGCADSTGGGSGASRDAFTTAGFTPGMVANADLAAADAGVSLGAKVIRFEFAIGANPTSFDSTFDYYADRGIRILMLAGFDGFSAPSVAQANNLGSWATRFGPGGTFWAGRSDGQLAVQHIEFGNELNYNYQAGGGNVTEAQNYAHRAVTAHNAIQFTGKPVGLLCMGMPADSGNAAWLNNMFAAEPGLASIVAGWTIHPYGPSYLSKLSSHISQLSSHGVPSSVPIDITEWGISSDNGRALSDNYGWPVNMTYAQAASALSTFISDIRNHATTIGPRLRHVLIYQTRDQAATGAITGREGYFGALQNNMAEKGAYTAAVRALLDD